MRKLISLTAGMLFLLAGAAWAADNPAPVVDDQVGDQETDQENTQQPDPDNSVVLEEGAAEADEEDEDSPGRFIPTEEISQDLGVSFPVDI